MKNVMGIILTGGKNNRLKELSSIRSISAVPVAGKYRAIDFALSSMVNSGITNVGVLTQYSFRSLMDHLGSGKEWDLDRKNDGLFVFPPYLSENDTGWYRGSSDAMFNNITFLKRSNEKYVVIAQGNCIYKVSFDSMLEKHIENKADITIAYREMNNFGEEELSLLGLIKIGDDGKILDLQEKPPHPWTKTGSMGIYIIERELLISLLEESVAHGNYDFVKDIVIRNLGTLNIYGYEYDVYWRSLSTVQMYYRCNMEMLDPEVRRELFIENGKVYTKVKDESPAKYNDEAEVKNSIIGDGCIIEGTVENCVLFRGVTIRKGAVVKDSIIMQGACIEENAILRYAILDKNVVMTQGKSLKGEADWPIIVEKNVRV
ncbi:glucose-1-phosphate adenylyltransferase [Anaerobacterium chartisolvens]|uniref:Glucose-1-phosphate adenylyltransferase n=1 Tax=Anaerobacterium chartisolvens TaxID=1297424 RepID=A0A369BEI8_9FIRM|nr:glucose-1-phosphate adenylyltransferase subunit GlgD [Anaerobacterium chartisolvens]RCX18887.1 glucose-1-phosphate adenylyltransferase [Anaerobacterium chartisolvens]